MAAGEEATVANNKIIAVGVGQVGKACESSILGKSLADELALVNAWKCICSMGTSFFRHLKLWQRTDHPVTMGITAGVHQRERESHLSPVRRNVFFKFIIPAIIKYSPNCIISDLRAQSTHNFQNEWQGEAERLQFVRLKPKPRTRTSGAFFL